MTQRPGLLVMAYGTPRGRDDIGAYYADIRHGRPPSEEQLADLVARYDAVAGGPGGSFPLRAHTDAQYAALQSALPDWHVALGLKHAAPRIEDGVSALTGCAPTVGLVLAPHYSADYAARAIGVDVIEAWHLLPAYLDFLADQVRGANAEVVFTAHSLPVRAASGYAERVQQTADAVAARAGLAAWSVAFQSAGRTDDDWLGPDIRDVIADRRTDLVVSPCGFTCDHLEVVYDLDIEAARVAESVGVTLRRTATVGADPAVIAGLAQLVRERAA